MLKNQLSEHVRACFPGLWVRSHEHDDALNEIGELCRDAGYHLLRWDCDRGLAIGLLGEGDENTDPLAALRALSAGYGNDNDVLLVLPNFHRFLNNPEVVQALVNALAAGKQSRRFVVVLSPMVQLPVELERHFVVLEHDLPNREQLALIAKGIATEVGEMPEGEELDRVLDAAVGLTRYEAEGAFSLSIVRHAALKPEPLWELKAGTLKKSGLLQLHRGGERFDDLGGLDALKAFCQRALSARGKAKPRGVLMLGVPGSGKSAFAKALGNETGRPTLCLDIGALMGSLVGQSEENVRSALRIADAMAPCVLMLDEVEKALSGAGGEHDGGVSTRLFGTLLTWLNDHTSDVFVVCTANDVSKLPPEFSRAERFDGIFFLDLPGEAERVRIWEMYVEQFGITLDADGKVGDDGWTGAEIKSCCRLASLLDVSLEQASQNVVPISRSAADKIANLRAWADGRVLDANRSGIYQRSDVASTARRQIERPTTRPSAN